MTRPPSISFDEFVRSLNRQRSARATRKRPPSAAPPRAPGPASSPEAAALAPADGEPPRVIAIDWSGDVRQGRRKIWLAEVAGGALVRLENGRDGAEIGDHLLALATADPHIVVGLDFAFSCPAWFLEERGLASGKELWRLADREAEQWLSGGRPPGCCSGPVERASSP